MDRWVGEASYSMVGGWRYQQRIEEDTKSGRNHNRPSLGRTAGGGKVRSPTSAVLDTYVEVWYSCAAVILALLNFFALFRSPFRKLPTEKVKDTTDTLHRQTALENQSQVSLIPHTDNYKRHTQLLPPSFLDQF